MDKSDIWPVIHDERKALAADLQVLDDGQWQAASLCSHWTVRDVTAHMTATAKITPLAFFAKLALSGFSLERLQDKDITVEKGASAADTLARFDAVVNSEKHPPGPLDSWLGEAILHAEDIRRPLAIQHDYPKDAVVRLADFYKGSNLVVGTKRRIEGLTLRATDADWSHGSGPEVSGPIMPLVMAMTGRKAALDNLTGDGVATLRTRA
ncbi:MAG TPA: maleylpyruvate isomerase family mycothiol-dependent enzyme [Streptosporangiaceae bacterium]|nr:maleylpyruvate isomerase family mycothiol-dependent enzyme [Streptosporangiaceae bacterium]